MSPAGIRPDGICGARAAGDSRGGDESHGFPMAPPNGAFEWSGSGTRLAPGLLRPGCLRSAAIRPRLWSCRGCRGCLALHRRADRRADWAPDRAAAAAVGRERPARAIDAAGRQARFRAGGTGQRVRYAGHQGHARGGGCGRARGVGGGRRYLRRAADRRRGDRRHPGGAGGQYPGARVHVGFQQGATRRVAARADAGAAGTHPRPRGRRERQAPDRRDPAVQPVRRLAGQRVGGGDTRGRAAAADDPALRRADRADRRHHAIGQYRGRDPAFRPRSTRCCWARQPT